jgi:hypothetical protein
LNSQENLVLQGLALQVQSLALEIGKQRRETQERSRFAGLPEWITLEQAAALKGGPALITYKQKKFLQPCCGLEWRLVGGRHCWRREDVIEWLSVTDEGLKKYAAQRRVEIPENYAKRSGGGE